MLAKVRLWQMFGILLEEVMAGAREIATWSFKSGFLPALGLAHLRFRTGPEYVDVDMKF